MIPTIAALLVVAPSTPEGQWGPTPMTAPALAAKVDNALATLKGVTVHFVYVYNTSVAYATKVCDGTFVSPTKFRLQVPAYDPKKEPVVDYETWVADGTSFGSIKSSSFPKPQSSVTHRPAGPAHPANLWFADFTRSMFYGVGQPTHPLQRFVSDARAQGYKIAVQTRRFPFRGAERTWYRLVAAKGTQRYETVFDATGYLPVNVTNTSGPKDSVHWYEVRWSKPKTLDASVARFTAPKSMQGSSSAPRPR